MLERTTFSAARRRPRFKRFSPVPLRLTEDDLTILRHVGEHRFLRSTHLVQLMNRSHDKIIRRLGALFHNGYLDRPAAQLDILARGGSAPLIYALGNKGALFDGATGIDWTDKNRDVKRPYIEHALMVADFMIALECGLRSNPDIKLVPARDIARRAWTMTVTIPGGDTELSVTPDKVFALDFANTGRRNYFLVEADRSTMPIERPSLAQSSFKKKLLAYHHGHHINRHNVLWGIPGFRVLTISKSEERVASMIATVKDITGGKGSNVFLFADPVSADGSDPLKFRWISGKGDAVSLS